LAFLTVHRKIEEILPLAFAKLLSLKNSTYMKELEALIETYKNAVFEKDLATFLSLFDEEVRVFDMWGCWSYDGLTAWREMVTGWFSSLGVDRDRLTFEEVEIFSVGDVATVTAFARFAAVSPEGEELRFLHNRLTWIVRKKAGARAASDSGVGSGVWKIIHQHTSAPIDSRSMSVMLQR
jgi:ketosteroid isomerase-like protein